MLNQVICVGRIVDMFNNYITIAIPRSYKNSEGNYDTDTLPIKISENIYNNVSEYCKTGDIVGIKGRLESDGAVLTVMCDKVTFLSSKSEGGE